MFFVEFIPTTMLQSLRYMTSKSEEWELLTLGEYITPKAEDLKFQESNKKPESGLYVLKLGIIRIAAENPCRGEDDENPYKHLEKLRQKFLARFFSSLKVYKLRKQVFNFEQRQDEDIDEAWERLEGLLTQGPLLDVTPAVHIHTFYYGLMPEAFEKVNITAGGSLLSITWREAKQILSDICMACKFNRERKDDGVKKRKEYMAPTYAVFEDQPPVKKTTVSYASDEEDYGSLAPQDETKSDYRSLASAKPLTEFEKMRWMPMEFGDTLKCAGPLPIEDLVEEELFPPEVPLKKNDDSQDTGEVPQKLFQEEELDIDFVC
ncbi:hypothetical protein U9M48_036156 [Paspalum notatum var. saurae]|uniref:Retrotransposon gag domain-containing protein n=1 Tax=Paspalum notatum var. saurae TaxID=547442 RepID=A0AAQ3UGN1_PASNO